MNQVEALARTLCKQAGWNPDVAATLGAPVSACTPMGAATIVGTPSLPLWTYWHSTAEEALALAAKP